MEISTPSISSLNDKGSLAPLIDDESNDNIKIKNLNNLKVYQNERFGKIGHMPRGHNTNGLDKAPLYELLNSTHQLDGEFGDYHRPCNCTKSYCLKLYCECFARDKLCVNCNCNNCMNNLSHEKSRSTALLRILDKNPMAFLPKIGSGQGQKLHRKGCNCKRSECLKNYCECREAKIECSLLCRCQGCKNRSNELAIHSNQQNSLDITLLDSNEFKASNSFKSQCDLVSDNTLQHLNSECLDSFNYPSIPIHTPETSLQNNHNHHHHHHHHNPYHHNSTIIDLSQTTQNDNNNNDNSNCTYKNKNIPSYNQQLSLINTNMEDFIKVSDTYKKISEEFWSQNENMRKEDGIIQPAKQARYNSNYPRSSSSSSSKCRSNNYYQQHNRYNNNSFKSENSMKPFTSPFCPIKSYCLESSNLIGSEYAYNKSTCITRTSTPITKVASTVNGPTTHPTSTHHPTTTSNTTNLASVQSTSNSSDHNAEVTSTNEIEQPSTMMLESTNEFV